MSKSTFLLSILLAIGLTSCAKKTDTTTIDSSSVATGAANGTYTDSTTQTTLSKADTASASKQPFDSAKVSINSLPATVKPYVEQHYPGYQIASAAFDPLCGGGPAIDVSIKSSGKPTYSVIFKPDGSFVQQEEDVAMSTAPAKVRDEVKKSYADWKAGNQIEKLTLADGALQYLVDLSKGKLKKEVIFSAAGAMVCENNEK